MPIAFDIHPIMLATVLLNGRMQTTVSIPIGLEMMAVVVASISGALSARERKLDLTAAVVLAVACSLGGGLLRDMILQVGDVYILKQPLALPVAVATAAIAFVLPTLFEKQDKLIAFLDIFAVGLYAAFGADKALVYGFEPIIGVMMGFFTAVGGGMLRDICMGRMPYIFQPSNLYAVAAVAGAVVYVTLVKVFDVFNVVALVVCVVVTMGLRFWSLRFNITSPSDMDLARAINRARLRAVNPAARQEKPVARSAEELGERRERVQAEIEQRRRRRRQVEALARMQRHRRSLRHRRLDV